jgi:hypothetical protein
MISPMLAHQKLDDILYILEGEDGEEEEIETDA